MDGASRFLLVFESDMDNRPYRKPLGSIWEIANDVLVLAFEKGRESPWAAIFLALNKQRHLGDGVIGQGKVA